MERKSEHLMGEIVRMDNGKDNEINIKMKINIL